MISRRCGLFGLALLLSLGAFTPRAAAYPVGSPSLGRLVKEAAWVGVGRVDAITPQGKETRATLGGTTFGRGLEVQISEATFQVEAVLKGDMPEGRRLAFRFPHADGAAMIVLEQFQVGKRYLVFLTLREDRYEPVDPLAGDALLLPDELVLPRTEGTTALAKAESLLVGLTETAPAGMRRALLKHIGVYRAEEAGGPDSDDKLPRGQFALPSTYDRLGALLVSEDPGLRLEAAMLLAQYQYLPALPILITEFTAFWTVPETARSKWWPPGGQIEWIIPNGLRELWQPEALPYQCALLRSSLSAIRREAAAALREAADPSTIPALMAILEDTDAEARYFAATSLAAVTKQNSHYLSTDAFRANETAEIAYWKDWWAQHKSRSEGTIPSDE